MLERFQLCNILKNQSKSLFYFSDFVVIPISDWPLHTSIYSWVMYESSTETIWNVH